VCSAASDDSGSKINDTDAAGVACKRALPIAGFVRLPDLGHCE
jgi:hypothetical protein